MSLTTVTNDATARPGEEPAEPPSAPSDADPDGASDEPPASPRASNAGAVTVQAGPGADASLDLAWLERQVRAAAAALGREVARATVRVVGDDAMRDYHERHLGLAEPTDVLTFDAAPEAGAVEADLVICADVAARRATERGHATERELLLYALHGLLHCCGHDDRDEEASRRMHEAEDRILEHIGVGATYAPVRAAGGGRRA